MTLYDLVPGTTYVVRRSFRDYYGGEFLEGERLRFRSRSFVPYHGGHTLTFEERSIYLQEEVNAAFIDAFSEYLERAQ